MKAIVIMGDKNVGKTTLINRVVRELQNDGCIIIKDLHICVEEDCSVVLSINDHVVLVHSATDDDKRIEELKKGIKETQKIDVVVTASRDTTTINNKKLHKKVKSVLCDDCKINDEDVKYVNINDRNILNNAEAMSGSVREVIDCIRKTY